MKGVLDWLRKYHTAITSTAAIAISVIALFVAWDQSRVMRAQQHADVWPAVQIETQVLIEDGHHILTVSLENDGIGPALIRRVDARFAGEDIAHWERLGEIVPDGLSRPDMWTGAAQGAVLSPGESSILAQLTWRATAENQTPISEYRQRFFEIDVSVCYCSVYERCWLARRDGRASLPEPVAACPMADPDSHL